MSIRVMSSTCERCLYGRNPLTSEKDTKQYQATIEDKRVAFECHRSTFAGGSIVCHLFYQLHKKDFEGYQIIWDEQPEGTGIDSQERLVDGHAQIVIYG